MCGPPFDRDHRGPWEEGGPSQTPSPLPSPPSNTSLWGGGGVRPFGAHLAPLYCPLPLLYAHRVRLHAQCTSPVVRLCPPVGEPLSHFFLVFLLWTGTKFVLSRPRKDEFRSFQPQKGDSGPGKFDISEAPKSGHLLFVSM